MYSGLSKSWNESYAGKEGSRHRGSDQEHSCQTAMVSSQKLMPEAEQLMPEACFKKHIRLESLPLLNFLLGRGPLTMIFLKLNMQGRHIHTGGSHQDPNKG